MSRLWEVVNHELRQVLPPAIFFLVAFHIVMLDRVLMLRESASATVAALLVAQIVLVTDTFPFVNRLILNSCASRQLIRVVGRDKVTQMLFGGPMVRRS